MKPYHDTILSEAVRVRYFEQGIKPDQMVWHRDQHDRVVEVVDGEGWLFQRDNKVPQLLDIGESIEISAGEWHRLIPGETDLIITITEKKLSKKQKKIARAAPPPDKITGADFAALRDDDSDESVDEDSHHDPDYEATGQRGEDLDNCTEKYEDGDVKAAARCREKMEEPHRDESLSLNEMVNDAVEEALLDEVLEEFERALDEKRKKRKKSGKSPKGLSKAVKKSLNKKADKRCLTRGSVYSEFRKGLAAFLSSGSRKGMSAHQWAHARVNSAQPSKKWATVKKRKKCPKKKKK